MATGLDIFPWFKNFMINPVTDWQRFINPQFNVTINQGDAPIENHVLARAGSYGKQIGRMQEVLDAILETIPAESFSPAHAYSIQKYHETRANVLDAVNDAKAANATDASAIDVDTWMDKLAALREQDPKRFEAQVKRIQASLALLSTNGSGSLPTSRKKKTLGSKS